MFQKIAKHRANDASNDVHRPPLDAAAVASERPWHWPVARCTRVPGVSGAHPGTRQWPEESLLQ